MVEVSTGRPPFLNIPHDERLALAICNGLRKFFFYTKHTSK
jgi:hypothetical protein